MKAFFCWIGYFLLALVMLPQGGKLQGQAKYAEQAERDKLTRRTR